MPGIVRALILLFMFFPHAGFALAAERPTYWAQPLDVAGVPNLHRITPNLFRSAQPTEVGMRNLEDMGIRTVISLRHFNDDHPLIAGTRMRLVEIPVDTWDIDEKQVVETLRTVLREEDGPFLIHCQHGADRTGVMSAMYRIVVQHWSRKEAIRELTNGGYGYHPIWFDIPLFIQFADVAKMRSTLDVH